jgi:hypothetical protein
VKLLHGRRIAAPLRRRLDRAATGRERASFIIVATFFARATPSLEELAIELGRPLRELDL